MSRNREVNDKKRNNIFAAAIDYLKRNRVIISQAELAAKMGVNKDTITNIIKYRTVVTEDVITKLQTASDCVFNLQWLRGESDVMLMEDLQRSEENTNVDPWKCSEEVGQTRYGSDRTFDIVVAAKDEVIASLKRELSDKDVLIEVLRQQVSDLRGMLSVQDPRKKMPAKDVVRQ